MISVDGNWSDPAETPCATGWVRETIAEAGQLPSAAGTYLNFSGDTDLDASSRQAAFGENLQRLTDVKTAYDPSNRFRLNNNVPPRTPAA